MRTIPKQPERLIAVMAKSTKLRREVILYKPAKKSYTHSTEFFSMLVTTTIDMVDDQKFNMSLTTTRTKKPVMLKHFLLDVFTPLSHFLFVFLVIITLMLEVVLFNFFPLFRGTLRTASSSIFSLFFKVGLVFFWVLFYVFTPLFVVFRTILFTHIYSIALLNTNSKHTVIRY